MKLSVWSMWFSVNTNYAVFLCAASITDVSDCVDRLSMTSEVSEQPPPSWDDRDGEKDGCLTEDDDNDPMKKPTLRYSLNWYSSLGINGILQNRTGV